MDVPLPKTIRIGTASVGLIGLEKALYAVLRKTVSDEQAAAELFTAVRKHNYIPESAVPLYKQALLEEYRRCRHQTGSAGHGIVIRVLGRPCVSCNKLKIMVIEVLEKLNLAADVEDVQDLDVIWRYGVTSTPALVINNVVKSAGRLPTLAEVEQWLRKRRLRYRFLLHRSDRPACHILTKIDDFPIN